MRILSALFIFFSLYSSAQEDQSLPIYFGAQFGPNLSYRVLSNNTEDSGVDDQINFLNNRESAAFGYRGALMVGVRILKNWSLEGGISYLRNSTDFEFNSGDAPESRRGFVSDNGFDKGTITSHLYYIGIPLRLGYSVGGEKIRANAQFGLTPQILIDQESVYTLSLQGDEVASGQFPISESAVGFNVSPSLGLGLAYRLSDFLAVTGDATARFGVININEESPINSYVYSSEFCVGLQYFLTGKW
jgi:hypothetical protein